MIGAAGIPVLAAWPASSHCVHAPWPVRLLGLAHGDGSCAEGSALGPSLIHLFLISLALAFLLAGAHVRIPDRLRSRWPRLFRAIWLVPVGPTLVAPRTLPANNAQPRAPPRAIAPAGG